MRTRCGKHDTPNGMLKRSTITHIGIAVGTGLSVSSQPFSLALCTGIVMVRIETQWVREGFDLLMCPPEMQYCVGHTLNADNIEQTRCDQTFLIHCIRDNDQREYSLGDGTEPPYQGWS